MESCSTISRHWSKVAKVSADETYARITDVESGTEYTFRVTAVNKAGPGEPSDASVSLLVKPRNGRFFDIPSQHLLKNLKCVNCLTTQYLLKNPILSIYVILGYLSKYGASLLNFIKMFEILVILSRFKICCLRSLQNHLLIFHCSSTKDEHYRYGEHKDQSWADGGL